MHVADAVVLSFAAVRLAGLPRCGVGGVGRPLRCWRAISRFLFSARIRLPRGDAAGASRLREQIDEGRDELPWCRCAGVAHLQQTFVIGGWRWRAASPVRAGRHRTSVAAGGQQGREDGEAGSWSSLGFRVGHCGARAGDRDPGDDDACRREGWRWFIVGETPAKVRQGILLGWARRDRPCKWKRGRPRHRPPRRT